MHCVVAMMMLARAGLSASRAAVWCPQPRHPTAAAAAAATAAAAAAAGECAALASASACHDHARTSPIPSHQHTIPSSHPRTCEAQARVDGAHSPRWPQTLLRQRHEAVQLDEAGCPGRPSSELPVLGPIHEKS